MHCMQRGAGVQRLPRGGGAACHMDMQCMRHCTGWEATASFSPPLQLSSQHTPRLPCSALRLAAAGRLSGGEAGAGGGALQRRPVQGPDALCRWVLPVCLSACCPLSACCLLRGRQHPAVPCVCALPPCCMQLTAACLPAHLLHNLLQAGARGSWNPSVRAACGCRCLHPGRWCCSGRPRARRLTPCGMRWQR